MILFTILVIWQGGNYFEMSIDSELMEIFILGSVGALIGLILAALISGVVQSFQMEIRLLTKYLKNKDAVFDDPDKAEPASLGFMSGRWFLILTHLVRDTWKGFFTEIQWAYKGAHGMTDEEVIHGRNINNPIVQDDLEGEQTLIELSRMQKKERIELLSFLDNLPYYIEINSPFFGNTILTHTGIDIDNLSYNRDNSINVKKSIEKAVNKNPFYMVGRDLHDMPYSYKKLLDSFLIVGHIPTIELNDSGSNCFYRTKYYMVIDAGASCVKRGGTLGCYCVDTDEEIYI